MSDYRLLIDTSERVGQVGLSRGDEILSAVTLDESRRHARDLTAQISQLLAHANISLANLHAIHVSIGPGGFTGLRVGVTTAKVLAYASQVPLVAVPCFHAIAECCEATSFWVIADALQGDIYLQRFERRDGVPSAIDALQIVRADQWLNWANAAIVVTGPGVLMHAERISCSTTRDPRSVSLMGLLLAGKRITPLDRAGLFQMEPLYFRASSAEEKAKREGRA